MNKTNVTVVAIVALILVIVGVTLAFGKDDDEPCIVTEQATKLCGKSDVAAFCKLTRKYRPTTDPAKVDDDTIAQYDAMHKACHEPSNAQQRAEDKKLTNLLNRQMKQPSDDDPDGDGCLDGYHPADTDDGHLDCESD